MEAFEKFLKMIVAVASLILTILAISRGDE